MTLFGRPLKIERCVLAVFFILVSRGQGWKPDPGMPIEPPPDLRSEMYDEDNENEENFFYTRSYADFLEGLKGTYENEYQ